MVMISEIKEEDNEQEDVISCINKEAQKEKIRGIIAYQKSLHFSSSSTSSSSSSSSSNSSNLLELMRRGSTSLGRLFGMEHTTLASHFSDYSCSPTTKTIPLWGSESDGENQIIRPDPWESIREFRRKGDDDEDDPSKLSCSDSSLRDDKLRFRRTRLSRKRSFRKLPKFRFWRWRLRLRRFRIIVCGRIFHR